MWKPGLTGFILVAACTQVAPPAGQEMGQEMYLSYCSSCHGRAGRGDGPLAARLPVPPADLTGLSARNGGAFPAGQVMAQIYGYPGRYHTSAMPEFGPLLEGARIEWTDETGAKIETPQALLDLSTYIGSLQESPG